ncbi:DUF4365 domain-containing protein [Amycolatopsis sp. NPDC050768]|uniref:DUF4365 domain-containing protein n=1 Tax=Amycolatopsis sp. NPDC050768 TaxID=3154839 RepID=UPI0033D7D878
MTTAFPDIHPSGAPFGTMHPNNCKEQISIAYAHAVTTAARCKLDHIEVDDNSVDAVVMQKANQEFVDGVELDIQLKCTSQDLLREESLSWPLDGSNYNELANERRYNKAILVVLVVPERLDHWLRQTEDCLQLVRCAYWVPMTGLPLTDQKSKTVKLPRSNIFNVEQLLGILQRIGSRRLP